MEFEPQTKQGYAQDWQGSRLKTAHWHEHVIKYVYFVVVTVSTYFAIQCINASATFFSTEVGVWVGCSLFPIAVGLWTIRG